MLIDNLDDFSAVLVLIKLVFIDRIAQETLAKEGNTFLTQRRALLDELLSLLLKSAEPAQSTTLESLDDQNRQRIVNLGTFLRYLPKNFLGVDHEIGQVYKDASFMSKLLAPVFEVDSLSTSRPSERPSQPKP